MKMIVLLSIALSFMLFASVPTPVQCCSSKVAKADKKEPAPLPSALTETKPDQPVTPQVNKLLDRIEKAGTKLKSFQADMTFKQTQILVETLTVRHGELYYQVYKNTIRVRIHFNDFLQQDLEDPIPSQAVKFDEDYVFDGLWITRRNARTKTVQSWEVSKKPGNKEAFRLGKGPFPLPFAIKKKDMLEHFDVSILKADPNDPGHTDHLRLVPKKKSSYAEEYVQMDLWISQKTSLPVQIRYENNDYEITTVTWSKAKIDKKIANKKFQLKPPGRGWSIEKIPLEESSQKSTR